MHLDQEEAVKLERAYLKLNSIIESINSIRPENGFRESDSQVIHVDYRFDIGQKVIVNGYDPYSHLYKVLARRVIDDFKVYELINLRIFESSGRETRILINEIELQSFDEYNVQKNVTGLNNKAEDNFVSDINEDEKDSSENTQNKSTDESKKVTFKFHAGQTVSILGLSKLWRIVDTSVYNGDNVYSLAETKDELKAFGILVKEDNLSEVLSPTKPVFRFELGQYVVWDKTVKGKVIKRINDIKGNLYIIKYCEYDFYGSVKIVESQALTENMLEVVNHDL